MEECGPSPVFASFTLAFALQLRKKHGKTSVRLRKTSVRVEYTYYQNTHTLQNPHKLQNSHKHTNYKTHTNTHTTKPTHTHTLQNNIKPPQYKSKQTQCKIYPMNEQSRTSSSPSWSGQLRLINFPLFEGGRDPKPEVIARKAPVGGQCVKYRSAVNTLLFYRS